MNPTLSLSRWITDNNSHTAAECEASNKLPCWSAKTDLSAAGNATGSINTTAILAADSDGLGDIDPRTFGEASVNFGAIVDQTKCVSFGSAYLKSRSSDSFTAALKDFITPVETNISNCGSVKVKKVDDVGALLTGAEFALVKDAAPIGGTPGTEDTEVVKTCATSGGYCTMDSIIQGDYWVIETKAPDGHDMAATPYQHVSIVADAEVEVEFMNPLLRGAIVVTKTRKHAEYGSGDYPHAGVTFTVNGENVSVSGQTLADGKVCFDGLLLGAYTVTETVPDHYAGEGPKEVVVSAKASCADQTNATKVSFKNTPLSNITVTFESQEPGGTKAVISCANLVSDDQTPETDVFDDITETYKNLLPGTYTCTVVVDP